ncbi:aldehyde dehydrogenase (NAD+) [Breoghania corrubedonensis]|uniref:Aldehyde dehydrogenase n=1 Tax=Breoghania corrubedonensis TaxID=665038 RepID=A0A2T5V7E3_9HYPH|nr:aldehyde dehydrogenase [Breoghania corrubedonensis]PTW59667.1 aldehyde dehydrogenase (NAD+) [Breoghania corrubedonensis]
MTDTLEQDETAASAAAAPEEPDKPARTHDDERTDIASIAEYQRAAFRTGFTRDIAFRRQSLKALRRSVAKAEKDILAAMQADLGRPRTEAYASEIAMLLREIDTTLARLRRWSKPRRVRSPLVTLRASSRVQAEPYGTTLIIAPWNYPFQLALGPLIPAIAAGNCAVVKPSESAPESSTIIARIIRETFKPHHVAVFEGEADVSQTLLDQRFDLIFYTGGTVVGRTVMQAASRHLTPVILELGGKNPCIVTADANLDIAARRIAWGKFLNAGQTCVAPDFILAEASIKDALQEKLIETIAKFYGYVPKDSPDYSRIVNERHFNRLTRLMEGAQIVAGGETDRDARYIAPTLISGLDWSHPLMAGEIFGPLLPIMAYEDLDTELIILKNRPKPLALYIFSNDRATQERILCHLPSGGAAINDTLSQVINTRLPFGGIGDSGMGAYHGKVGFDAFSHQRAIVRRALKPEGSLLYPPYKTPLWVLRRMVRFF